MPGEIRFGCLMRSGCQVILGLLRVLSAFVSRDDITKKDKSISYLKYHQQTKDRHPKLANKDLEGAFLPLNQPKKCLPEIGNNYFCRI